MNSNLCGKMITVENVKTGATAQAMIADTCPTCENSASIDLSTGLFGALTNNDYDLGIFDIKWKLN